MLRTNGGSDLRTLYAYDGSISLLVNARIILMDQICVWAGNIVGRRGDSGEETKIERRNSAIARRMSDIATSAERSGYTPNQTFMMP